MTRVFGAFPDLKWKLELRMRDGFTPRLALGRASFPLNFISQFAIFCFCNLKYHLKYFANKNIYNTSQHCQYLSMSFGRLPSSNNFIVQIAIRLLKLHHLWYQSTLNLFVNPLYFQSILNRNAYLPSILWLSSMILPQIFFSLNFLKTSNIPSTPDYVTWNITSWDLHWPPLKSWLFVFLAAFNGSIH